MSTYKRQIYIEIIIVLNIEFYVLLFSFNYFSFMLLVIFRNPVHVSLALQCIANIGSKEMAEAFGHEIPKLLVSGWVKFVIFEQKFELKIKFSNIVETQFVIYFQGYYGCCKTICSTMSA